MQETFTQLICAVKFKLVLRSSDWNLSGILGILLDEFVSDLWTWVIDAYAQYHFINHNIQYIGDLIL